MNAETIEHWLAAVGVPAGVVSVGAEADDAWCLLRRDADPDADTDADADAATHPGTDAGTAGHAAADTHPGDAVGSSAGSSIGVDAADAAAQPDAPDRGERWEVFWREQGNRYDWACFSNEQVACFYLFGRLTWTLTASGVLGADRSDQVDVSAG